MAIDSDEEILTASQVAKLLKVTVRKVLRELRRKTSSHRRLPSFKVGREVRFWQSEVLAWAKEQSEPIDEDRPRPVPKPKRR